VALCCIAEWHSADCPRIPPRNSFSRPADCQSATQQIANLRYKISAAVAGRRYNGDMGSFPVSPEKEDQLTQRMAALGVRESDVEETFVRSGGHGGQNVNKVATCVMLLHRPSGVQVKCQETRQQGMNRFIARRLLLDKIEGERRNRANAERARIEKARRQKRKRSKGAKERMLADKSRQAEKKRFRRAVSMD